MDKRYAKALIKGMRRDLNDISFELAEIEQLLNDPNYSFDYYRGDGFKDCAKELIETRKYFNAAFRNLIAELNDDE